MSIKPIKTASARGKTHWICTKRQRMSWERTERRKCNKWQKWNCVKNHTAETKEKSKCVCRMYGRLLDEQFRERVYSMCMWNCVVYAVSVHSLSKYKPYVCFFPHTTHFLLSIGVRQPEINKKANNFLCAQHLHVISMQKDLLLF